MRSSYYDTALSPSPYAMAALRALVEPEHILFGSDYPFAPAVVAGLETRALEQLTALDPQTKSGIDRAHALKLFPRFGPPARDAGRPHFHCSEIPLADLSSFIIWTIEHI